MMTPRSAIDACWVNAAQMRQIEARLFEAGMPVAALMEKVAGQIVQRLLADYPRSQFSTMGILIGPGHNGGDGLVVARELWLQGYDVRLHYSFTKLKPLTQHHAQYAAHLGIPQVDVAADLADCDLMIDALFGFGLTRPLTGAIATLVQTLNRWAMPIVSLDLPSGIHTDTGQVLGAAVRASHTLCLGLWKRAFGQDCALDFLGRAELIDFGIPLADIEAVLGDPPPVQRITATAVRSRLPLQRPQAIHKYQVGHVLLICGSRQFAGAALLAGLGARASGVGMVTLVVPESLRLWLVGQLPEALVVGSEETATGAIAQLPDTLNLENYNAIACGPGLTLDAQRVVQQVLDGAVPLLLDADGLNRLAQLGATATLQSRPAPTVLTPHRGEFERLFPHLLAHSEDGATAAQTAAQTSGAVVVLKGARSAIAAPNGSLNGVPSGSLWINPTSTPALARGGSGDVLTGLTAGLMAQGQEKNGQEKDGQGENGLEQSLSAALAGSWWHAQTGCWLGRDRGVLGVDPKTLAEGLIPALSEIL